MGIGCVVVLGFGCLSICGALGFGVSALWVWGFAIYRGDGVPGGWVGPPPIRGVYLYIYLRARAVWPGYPQGVWPNQQYGIRMPQNGENPFLTVSGSGPWAVLEQFLRCS